MIRTLLLFFLLCAKLQAKTYDSYANLPPIASQSLVNLRVSALDAKRVNPYQYYLDGKTVIERKGYSLGSGLVYDQNGYILANHHQVKGLTKVDVLFFPSELIFEGQVVASDDVTNLSLIKVSEKAPLAPLTLADSRLVQVGDLAFILSQPFGRKSFFQRAMIGALSSPLEAKPEDGFFVLDVPTHPGNCGAPLIDLRGRLIGLTLYRVDIPHMGFVIPSHILTDLVEQLLKYGKILRSWAGIVTQNAPKIEFSQTQGVSIINLIADGPGRASGLEIGDMIVSLDQKPISHLAGLQSQMMAKKPKTKVTLTVYRQSKGKLDIQVLLEERPKVDELPDVPGLL